MSKALEVKGILYSIIWKGTKSIIDTQGQNPLPNIFFNYILYTSNNTAPFETAFFKTCFLDDSNFYVQKRETWIAAYS